MNKLQTARHLSRLLVIVVSLGLATVAFGQTDQGRIVGTVTDPNNAIVPGATVMVKNDRTGEERTVTTNQDGNFLVPSLKAATYTVTASAANFANTKITDVQLSVGQELTLNLALKTTDVTASVVVTGASEAAMDTGSAKIGAAVNEREVEGLPVNGRQLSQLYLQAPGSVNSGSGTFADIRFSGRANQQNVIRYDGVEGTAIIDASPGNLNGEVPTPFRLQSSLENVQEFRVDSSNYPAEYGTGTGGQINVVTKSGGNQFHGSAFEYLRNSALDARNFFDLTTKSPLRLNQFGGSLGGPIIKDKLFFFGSYEGYRLRSGINFIEAVPSAAAKARAVPAIAPLIDGFKDPNAVILPGASANPDFAIAQLQASNIVNENAYAARFDYKPNDTNSLYFRFFRDKGVNNAPEGVTGRHVVIEAVPQNAVFGYQKILSTNLINEFRLGYNGARTRINGVAPTVNGIDFSAITLNISGSVANTGIAGQGSSSGVAVPGGLVRANSATNGRGQPYTPYSLSFIDSLNWIKGNHSFKFGGEVRAIRLYTDRLGGTTYTFSNLNAFLANTPSSIQYLGDVSAPSPFTGATGNRLAKQEYYIGYAQDEWKIRPNLTLNYGLRYEYYTPLREDKDRQILFDIVSGTLRPPTEDPLTSKKNNFGPRIAITWSPNMNSQGFFGGGRTVIRGGFGIYYGPGQTEDQIQPIESDRIASTISSGSLLAYPLNIPAVVANFTNNPLNRSFQPRAYARDYSIPEKVYQYSVSLQQELPYNMVLTAAYVGAQGRNLFLRSVANKLLPGQTTILDGTTLPGGVGVINRRNAAGQVIGVSQVREFDIINGTAACGAIVCKPFAEIDYKTSGGSDSYNALQMSLARRFDTGLTLNAQYTLARSFGNTAGSNEARTSAQLDNFEADRGYNNFDVRHSFNLSALYDLPIGRGRSHDFGSVGNTILGNWQVGGIVNARSGLPIEVNVVRPDVVMQCASPTGCVVPISGGTTTLPNGFVANLPGTINGTNPLPPGFIAVVNTPGGGASRNIRRPDFISGVSPYLNSGLNILNPAAFATPAPGAFGSVPRNALRGPSFTQFDLVLDKRFPIREGMNVEFRTEIFNIFNHPNFANPSATLNNALPNITVNPATGLFTVSSGTQPGQAFTQSAAGSTFGLLRSTVERTVGLGTQRQIQFALRLNF
jgi:hypothetical protein